MRIIISPAKKMNADIDSLPWKEYPFFLPQTETILQTLRTMDGAELKNFGSVMIKSPN